MTCPQCGQPPYATYYERRYGVAPEVAQHRGWPLGHQWAVCLFGHRWVPALVEGEPMKCGRCGGSMQGTTIMVDGVFVCPTCLYKEETGKTPKLQPEKKPPLVGRKPRW